MRLLDNDVMVERFSFKHRLELIRLSLGIVLPCGLVAFGWYGLATESRSLEQSTIETYQNAQLELVRSAARSAKLYMTKELESRPEEDIPAIEQEVLRNFVKPLRLQELGDAWIYAPDHVVFDLSEDFPEAYRGKSMAQIFALQRHRGAAHYEPMVAAVSASQEGVGWYIWEPDKARDATAWWEPLTQDSGREIAAWSPVRIFPDRPGEKTWIIGMSAMLPELMRANGSYQRIQSRMWMLLALSGLAIALMVLSWRNELRRRSRDREMRHLAFTDGLTGLANRRQMYAEGERLLGGGDRSASVALLYLDLNGFKDVNDSLGHDLGDALLVEVALRLRDCLRQQDVLARLGGDEFAILLHPSSLINAQAIAQRMLSKLLLPFVIKGKSIIIGASLGIAVTPKDSDSMLSFSQLLTQADIAMYQAKQRGLGSAVVFGEEMQRAAIARLQLAADLRQAIPNGELTLHYQPIFDLSRGGAPAAFEALVRWCHPQQGLLLPQAFLPEAESIDQIVDIDRWVFRQVCKTLAQWQEQLPSDSPFSIHVNLSRRSLGQPDLVAFVTQQLRWHQLQPQRLTLEILEETVIDEHALLEQNLHELRDLGVRLSLDDFGTGYSSLSYLHRLPVHGIKIDRAFVRHMHDNPKNQEVIRSILTLARSLDLETVAEGIELDEQLIQLKQLQCNYGQGHLLSGALEEAQAWALLFSQQPQPGRDIPENPPPGQGMMIASW